MNKIDKDEVNSFDESETHGFSQTIEIPHIQICEHRPWGTFTVLEEGKGYKVKNISVTAGKRLSYQKHARRCEHWIVVQGVGIVTLNEQDQVLRVGDKVDVPIDVAHRIQNPGIETLVFIEVQQGDYLGEDDIVRLQDDFGRVDSRC